MRDFPVMAEIDLESLGGDVYRVRVTESGTSTVHEVKIPRESTAAWGVESVDDEKLLRSSFEFLLAREPKESILRRFSLDDIPIYFPEYPREIGKSVRAK